MLLTVIFSLWTTLQMMVSISVSRVWGSVLHSPSSDILHLIKRNESERARRTRQHEEERKGKRVDRVHLGNSFGGWTWRWRGIKMSKGFSCSREGRERERGKGWCNRKDEKERGTQTISLIQGGFWYVAKRRGQTEMRESSTLYYKTVCFFISLSLFPFDTLWSPWTSLSTSPLPLLLPPLPSFLFHPSHFFLLPFFFLDPSTQFMCSFPCFQSSPQISMTTDQKYLNSRHHSSSSTFLLHLLLHPPSHDPCPSFRLLLSPFHCISFSPSSVLSILRVHILFPILIRFPSPLVHFDPASERLFSSVPQKILVLLSFDIFPPSPLLFFNFVSSAKKSLFPSSLVTHLAKCSLNGNKSLESVRPKEVLRREEWERDEKKSMLRVHHSKPISPFTSFPNIPGKSMEGTQHIWSKTHLVHVKQEGEGWHKDRTCYYELGLKFRTYISHLSARVQFTAWRGSLTIASSTLTIQTTSHMN